MSSVVKNIMYGSADEGKTNSNFRSIVYRNITPDDLAKAAKEMRLRQLLRPFDEVDITLTDGKVATVVCAAVSGISASFVFKDCIGCGPMNENPANKDGYYNSDGRKKILDELYPLLPEEWREIIVPRVLCEIVGGEIVEYTDPLWLPSAMEVFAPGDCGYLLVCDKSSQFPIFEKAKDRIKGYGDEGIYSWWLRDMSSPHFYRRVCEGNGYSCNELFTWGFAPGFDI